MNTVAVKTVTLTDACVRDLPLVVGREIIRDDLQPGFFLIVGRKTKTYFVQFDYKDAQGRRKTCRCKLGRCDQITAVQARAKAEEMIAGKRPPEKKLPERPATVLTLRAAWDEYRELHLVPENRSERTIQTGQYALDKFLSDWRDVPLDLLAQQPVEVKRRYVELKSRSVASAYQAMATLKAVYNHAASLHPELQRMNPVRFKLEMPAARESAMSLDELPGWYRRLRELPCGIRQEYHLFMILSACRREALSCARWEHLDVKRRALHIPKPKGGVKRAFDIPLSRAMLRCLWRARKAGRCLCPGSPWIFPSATSESGHIAEVKEKRMKTGHALRHTWRTLAQQVDGVSEIDAKLIMNHSLGGGANAGYISRAALWPHLLALQEKISAFVMKALTAAR